MKNITLSLLALLFILSPVALGQAPPVVVPLTGTYKGKVFNGGVLDPVLTTFKLSKDGKVSGTYEMKEEEGIETGTLTNFKWKDAHVLICTWKDKYGSGILKLTFSADRSKFKGFWGGDLRSATLQWDGVKLKGGNGV